MLNELITEALDEVIAAHPEIVVSVTIGSNSYSAISSVLDTVADLEDIGEVGNTAGFLYLKASGVSVERGESITVAGFPAFVTSVKKDPTNSILTIGFILKRQ